MARLPKGSLRASRRITPWMAAALLLLAGAGPATADSSPLETFAPRQAAAILPANMLSGPHFQVVSAVQTFGYMNNFVVQSEYGTFQAPSNTMLRRLIREIAAIDA
ncbi:MAG TPA: hypothetical protein VMW18_13380, partial [Candidatus Binatia bacterium]|nr:hypothetical protein [Candidatus Binatia bacterium]